MMWQRSTADCQSNRCYRIRVYCKDIIFVARIFPALSCHTTAAVMLCSVAGTGDLLCPSSVLLHVGRESAETHTQSHSTAQHNTTPEGQQAAGSSSGI